MTQADALPWNEAARSSALHAFSILDTPRERDFDDLASIASEICGTPIGIVNLIDTNRQFFKAEVGLGVRSTPLDTAFCSHALLLDDVMVVPDATKDARFECNPLVVGAPGLRSYAGALIKTEEGLPLGTVCVLDYVTREFSEKQLNMLRFLARQAMLQLELRRTVATQRRLLARARMAERLRANFERIVRQASDFIGIADEHGRVVFLNDAARAMVGLDVKAPLPSEVIEYIADEDRSLFREQIAPVVRAGEACEREIRLRHFGGGENVPALYTMFPIRDDDELVGYGVVTKDITEQKEENERRGQMMAEAAHRIKNTLAVVQGIVSQSLRTSANLEDARTTISKRVAALAKAQDILTSAQDSLADIAHIVEGALAPHDGGSGRFRLDGPSRSLDAHQSLGLSLALHELATNATKYGALSGEEGTIDVRWSVDEDGTFQLDWIESGGPPVVAPAALGFGSRLITRMVAPYFAGTVDHDFHPDGVRFSLRGRLPHSS